MLRAASRPARKASLLGVLIALLAGGCRPDTPPSELVDETRVVMGSSLRIAVATTRRTEASAAIGDAFAEMERLEALLTVWRETSDISRLNAAAGTGRPVEVAEDTVRLLGIAQEAGRATGGKFDVTFGALSDVWRFDHDQDNSVPSAEAIAARLPFIDYTRLHVDSQRREASVDTAGVRVHLGGIGKGYAVDRVAALLRARGFNDFLIQGGGDLYASGRNGARAWRVGIQDPRGTPDESFATIEVENETVSTSGDYERYFEHDGVRYHHLLDPDTGWPATGVRSVTVVAPHAVDADWLSTGVFILGPERGMALVDTRPDVGAVIVTASGELRVSSRLRERLQVQHLPRADAPVK
jgi:thiamine biosynthesis lipoprotein